MQENIGNGIFVPAGVIKARVPRPLTADEKARIKAEARLPQSLGDLWPTDEAESEAKPEAPHATTVAKPEQGWGKPAGSLGTPAHFGQGASHPSYGNGKRDNGNGKKKKGDASGT